MKSHRGTDGRVSVGTKFLVGLLSNVATGGAFFLFLLAVQWPFGLERTLIQRYQLPDTVVVISRGNIVPAPPGGHVGGNARDRLSEQLATGNLAFVGPLVDSIDSAPYVRASSGVFELGVFHLLQGNLPRDGEVLALAGSPYAIGDIAKVAGRRVAVSGIATPTWFRGALRDTAVLIMTDELPTTSSSVSAFYAAPGPVSVDDILNDLRSVVDASLVAQPLFEHLLSTEYVLDQRQMRHLARLAVLMFTVALVGLYTSLNAAWYRSRDRLQMERILGTPLWRFRMRWMVAAGRRFLPGLGAAAIIASIVRSSWASGAARSQVLGWLALMVGIAVTFSLLTAFISARAPLAERPGSRLATVGQAALIGMVSAVVVLVVTVLSQGLVENWRAGQQQLEALGADVLLATTTQASSALLTGADCPDLVQVVWCAPFAYSRIHLWPEKFVMSEDLIGVATFRPVDAGRLRMVVVEGGLPDPGELGAVVNERYVTDIRTEWPGFGVGSELFAGVTVTGIVCLPDTRRTAFEQDLYEAPVLMPQAVQGPYVEGYRINDDRFFKSPLGYSGLRMSVAPSADVASIKAMIWEVNSNVEFSRPAAYALRFAAATSDGLRRMLMATAASLLMTWWLIWQGVGNLLERMRLHIAVLRLLGMSSVSLSRSWALRLGAVTLLFGWLGLFAAYLLVDLRGSVIRLDGALLGVIAALLGAVVAAGIAFSRVRSACNLEAEDMYRRAV